MNTVFENISIHTTFSKTSPFTETLFSEISPPVTACMFPLIWIMHNLKNCKLQTLKYRKKKNVCARVISEMIRQSNFSQNLNGNKFYRI